MAFKQCKGKQGSRKLDVPAITINKSMATLNQAFCQAIDMKTIGDIGSLDLFYDLETKKFALKVHKDENVGEKLLKYNKSRQAGIYVKGQLKNEGYRIPDGSSIQCLLKYSKKYDMWLFRLPKECRIPKEDKTVNILNKKSKKKEKRNKRKKSEIKRKK